MWGHRFWFQASGGFWNYATVKKANFTTQTTTSAEASMRTYFFWLFKFTSRGVKCFVFFSFTKLLKIGHRCGLLLLPVVVLRRFFISRSLAFSFLFALLFAMCFLRIKSGTHAASFCFTMTENKLCNFITHTAVGRALMATHTTALEVNILIISS